MRLSDHERAYFKACSDELLEHHLVQSMSRYEQHGTTNRLDHSVQVAQYSYWVSKKLKLKLGSMKFDSKRAIMIFCAHMVGVAEPWCPCAHPGRCGVWLDVRSMKKRCVR